VTIPRTLVGETLAPWHNDPVFGCADKPEQRHQVVRTEDITSKRRVARVVGKSGVIMIAGASLRVELMRSASANHSHRAAAKLPGVRETMKSHRDDLLAGSTTRGAGDVCVTREEAA
jgi:hypothetical protein